MILQSPPSFNPFSDWATTRPAKPGQAQSQQSPYASSAPYGQQQSGAQDQGGSSSAPPGGGQPAAKPGQSQQTAAPQGGFSAYSPQQGGVSAYAPQVWQQQMPNFQFRATDFMGNTFSNPADFTNQQGAMLQAMTDQRSQQLQGQSPWGPLNPAAAYQQGQQMIQGGWTNPFAQPQPNPFNVQQTAQPQGNQFQDLFTQFNFQPPPGFLDALIGRLQGNQAPQDAGVDFRAIGGQIADPRYRQPPTPSDYGVDFSVGGEGQVNDPRFRNHGAQSQPRQDSYGHTAPTRQTPGYGTPPELRGNVRNRRFEDRDGDGVDDRDQDGPGMPKYGSRPRDERFPIQGLAQPRQDPYEQPIRISDGPAMREWFPIQGQAQPRQDPYEYSTPVGGMVDFDGDGADDRSGTPASKPSQPAPPPVSQFRRDFQSQYQSQRAQRSPDEIRNDDLRAEAAAINPQVRSYVSSSYTPEQSYQQYLRHAQTLKSRGMQSGPELTREQFIEEVEYGRYLTKQIQDVDAKLKRAENDRKSQAVREQTAREIMAARTRPLTKSAPPAPPQKTAAQKYEELLRSQYREVRPGVWEGPTMSQQMRGELPPELYKAYEDYKQASWDEATSRGTGWTRSGSPIADIGRARAAIGVR